MTWGQSEDQVARSKFRDEIVDLAAGTIIRWSGELYYKEGSFWHDWRLLAHRFTPEKKVKWMLSNVLAKEAYATPNLFQVVGQIAGYKDPEWAAHQEELNSKLYKQTRKHKETMDRQRALGDSQTLYRFWDRETLIYVGVSINAYSRAKQHSQAASWWGEATSVTFEKFPTRDAVLEAEKSAIKSEKPKYNVVHNTTNRPTPATNPLTKAKRTPETYDIWTRNGYNRGPTKLSLEWEVDCSSVFGEYDPSEQMEAWREFIRLSKASETRNAAGSLGRVRPPGLSIIWILAPLSEFVVCPDFDGSDVLGETPFEILTRDHTYPINSKTSERLSPGDLPMAPTRNSELMYKDTSWRPSMFQRTVLLSDILLINQEGSR